MMTQRPPKDDHVHPDVERQLSDLKSDVAVMKQMISDGQREAKKHRNWIRENMATKAQVAPLIRIGWMVGSAVILSIVTALLALVVKPELLG